MKSEFGKSDKVIIRVPYNQELIKKVKTISGRRWKRYRPQRWLFKGAKEGRHLSTRTADKIFKNAYKKAGIYQ